MRSVSQRDTSNCFSEEVSDTTSAFAHSTRNTAIFNVTKEYCTRAIVFFWQPRLAVRNGRLPLSRSKVFFIPEEYSFSLRKRVASSGTTRRDSTSCACLTLAVTSNMEEKSVNSISPRGNASAVSYTHLTLPTNREV